MGALLAVALVGWGALAGSTAASAEAPPRGVLVAHALGSVDGITYSNSREAFLHSWALGRRWFEVDVELTADGQLACFHSGFEWRLGLVRPLGELALSQFLTTRFDDRLTTMSLAELLGLLRDRPAGRLVIDAGTLTARHLDTLDRTVAAVAPALRPRLLVECYWPGDVDLVRRSEAHHGPFGAIVLAPYQSDMRDTEVVALVATQRIEAVTLGAYRFNHELVRRLHEVGAVVLLHTVNDDDDFIRLAAAGADGFLTDSCTARGAALPTAAAQRQRLSAARRQP